MGVLLFLPYRAMEARVFERLAAAGFDDFTPAQARVFQRIAPGGSRLAELAEAIDEAQKLAWSLGVVEGRVDPVGWRQQFAHGGSLL